MQQKLPLRDAVLFVSWKGKQCGDNPRGIAAELRRRGDDREHIWAVNDWSVPVPPGARGVLAGTEEYFEALARCRYVISNDDMQATYTKRDGQIYVQTWHGTPLKKIGFDIGQPQFVSGSAYLEQLARDIAKWDLLLSPNPFSTPIMRRAFRFGGEICESGYPRNDVLALAGCRARSRAEIRRRIGIPAGKRVVLYAPTWRDNQYYASGRYRFDFRLDLERAWQVLGADYVILIRGHHHMADDVPSGTRPGFAVNVTGYPDIAELYLISDVLVTDYSSAMFDFAATGRPMVFFTYDLEAYRDNLRGFYFDFEAEAPGPLLNTTGDVAAAIADIGRGGRPVPGGLPGVHRQVLPARRRQGRRPGLRPDLRLLAGLRGQAGTRGVLRQRGPQPGPAAVQPGHHRADRRAHHLGNLLVRVSLDVGQVDRHPEILGQRAQRAQDVGVGQPVQRLGLG